MKKIITLLLFCFVSLICPVPKGWACTNFLVSKGASTTGSTFITYAADSHTLYGELYHWPAAQYAEGTKLKVYEWDTRKYLGEIAQVKETYNVIGNMNEYGLAIAETTFGGREELMDTTGIMDYGSLIYITLQRARNSREAIKIMTDLVAEYGYYSSGESFSISDPNEVWIVEMISKGMKATPAKKGIKSTTNALKGAVWVAIRIPDGYVSAHANQARIQTFEWSNGRTSISSKEMDKINEPNLAVVYAVDVADVARQYGFYSGKDADFSFSDVYAPVDFGAARFCDARAWTFFKSVNAGMMKYQDYAMGHNLKNRMPLYIKPDQKVSFEHTANMMRDHYEGTPMDMRQDIGAGPHKRPYRWRPMTWEVDGQKYVHERAVATQQTGFWFVAESRSNMPKALSGILWFGLDDAATSCLTPIYAASNKVAEEFAVGNGDLLNYSDNAAFWVFSRVSNFAYLRYDLMSVDITKVQLELETKHREQVKACDQYVSSLYSTNPERAIEYVTDFSTNTASAMVSRWKKLDQYLLVKYIDGNVKKEGNNKFEYNDHGMPASPIQPALPEEWRRVIKNETLKAH